MFDANAKRDPAALRTLIGVASDAGLGATALLAGTGLTAALLETSEFEIEAWKELRAIENLMRFRNEPALGLEAGRRIHITTQGILGYAMLSSRSINEALAVAHRFRAISLWLCSVEFALAAGAGTFTLHDHMVPASCRPFCIARGLSSLRVWMSEMLRREIAPLQASFRFPAPGDPALFERHFGSNVAFGTPTNRIAFPAALFDEPMSLADAGARSWCETQLERALNRRAVTTANRIRNLIARPGGGFRSELDIAGEMKMTSSTLRRRLRAEGTTFQAVRSEVVHSLARDMLVTSSLSIDEIAQRIGFSESSSFVRWFKRQQGVAPGTWRRTAQGEAQGRS